MKKFLLSLAVFVASTAYVIYQYIGGGNAAPTQTADNISVTAPIIEQPTKTTTSTVSNTDTGTGSQPVQTPVSAPTPTPTPTPTPKPQGQYTDGTYTGSTADAYYGMVQVKATIQAGKLTDVTFLQYPNDRRTSQYINSQAMPQLRQEAIQAQSANVSGVSGASDTSAAFRESLSNALAQAKN